MSGVDARRTSHAHAHVYAHVTCACTCNMCMHMHMHIPTFRRMCPEWIWGAWPSAIIGGERRNDAPARKAHYLRRRVGTAVNPPGGTSQGDRKAVLVRLQYQQYTSIARKKLYQRLVEEHARRRRDSATTLLVADPPTALAVTAEGASCAARAVPSDSVPCMLAAMRVPTDRFADGVPGAGREPSVVCW